MYDQSKPGWALIAFAVLTTGCQMESLHALRRSSQSLSQQVDPQPGFQPPVGFTLTIQASALSVTNGGNVALNVTNGQGPFAYRIAKGQGAVSAAGVFTASIVPGRVIIEVMDSRGERGQAAIGVMPNDTMFGQLYGLNNPNDADIDALEAWDLQTDCRSIRVGVIDTGMDYTHPELMTNLGLNAGEIAGNGLDDDANGFIDDIMGWNFVTGTNDPRDDNLHGTHVAGTIGALGGNGVGVAGICVRASIVPLKFLDDAGGGDLFDAISAFDYARKINLKVLNNSWGGGGFDNTMLTAIQALNTADVLFLAAAGNDGTNNDTVPSFPANYNVPNVVSVAATNNVDAIANFSNFGATSVDIAAPGVNILSTFPVVATAEMTLAGFATSYEKISGTSMATPHVAGAAALVWAYTPTFTMLQVRDALLNNADTKATLTGRVVGTRRLNLMRALDPNYPRP